MLTPSPFFTAPVAVGYVPTSTIFEIKVANIPESLIPELENKSCHASTMFNRDPVAVNWFRENLVMPMDWTLDHPHDVPPNASNKFEEQLPSFARLGYKTWNIENRQHATSYIKVTSEADKSFINIGGRADYLITREGVTVAEYLNKILCVIEIQSKHGDRNTELCELQMQVYLLILMNTKHLPAVVGFLVLDNGQCRAFKSTRDESGGCLFEMNDVFHVGYIAQVMDNVIKSLGLL
jgi:hypothetical protein